MYFKKITFLVSEAADSTSSFNSDDEAELVRMSARKVTKETLQSFFEEEEIKCSEI